MNLQKSIQFALVALSLAACSQRGHAEPPQTASKDPAMNVGGTANAEPSAVLANTDAAMKAALLDAEMGRLSAAQKTALAGHPLFGWLEYAELRRNLNTITLDEGNAFLQRHANDAVGKTFRDIWLPTLSRRMQWAELSRLADLNAKSDNERCLAAYARAMGSPNDTQWAIALQPVYANGKPFSESCQPVMQLLESRALIGNSQRWQRIDNAIENNQPNVIRDAAVGLPPEEAGIANAYASFLTAVQDSAMSLPKDERSRKVITSGLVRLAKSSPITAEMTLPRYVAAFDLDSSQSGKVLNEIAVQSAVSYEPEALRRLNAVPAVAYDERFNEVRVREAMARSDWRGARAAIRAMPAEQRDSARWRYFDARFSELIGDQASARENYRKAAEKSEFYGYLAADRINAPYALCEYAPALPLASVQGNPALQRALALRRIGRKEWAAKEWAAAVAPMSREQRFAAIEVAQKDGWFDRGVFGFDLKDPEEARFYRLRFPIHHAETIQREAAKNALDPAWVAAEIRAESLFDAEVKSPAGAMGLMQLMPATGMATANRIGLPYAGSQTLYEPDANIALGSAYLREMWNKYGQLPYAIAAYNAGPGPVARWTSQRGSFDPDTWIETISYKETREYVPRVLAFSVMYDWRMRGDALRLTDRMAGRMSGNRTRFVCPAAHAAR